MQNRLILDVVVGERAVILEILAVKDEALSTRDDVPLPGDQGLDTSDRVAGLHIEKIDSPRPFSVILLSSIRIILWRLDSILSKPGLKTSSGSTLVAYW